MFGISLTIYPILEGGHEILHSFKNSLHHHEVEDDDHHHTIADHHVGQDDDHDHDLNEESEGANFISLLFGLSIPLKKREMTVSWIEIRHSTNLVSTYASVATCPPTPPPLG